MNPLKQVGWMTGASLVIANMIGTGVFTSLGFQLVHQSNTWSILLLWVLGAVMALCGALSYAELGTHLVRSGGEYHYLSELYHPLVGFLSGWVSMTIGFAAPIALAAIALSQYTSIYLTVSPKLLACAVVVMIGLVHSFNLKVSSTFQVITTVAKVAFILLLIGCGFYFSSVSSSLDWTSTWTSEIKQSSYAVSFVYVSFAYTGWNAAAYIVEEIKTPIINLPKALIIGTGLVALLYVALNFIFLKQATLSQLQGQLEVGQIVASNMFGPRGGQVSTFIIGLLLVSSISAMTWAGPRVTQVMSEEHKIFSFLSPLSSAGLPIRAIWFQVCIAILLILSGSFEQVLIYSGFILQLFGALAVFSIFLLRRRPPTGEKKFLSPFYPIPQILFTIFSIWILIFLVQEQPLESFIGIVNLLVGAIIFYLSKKYFPV